MALDDYTLTIGATKEISSVTKKCKRKRVREYIMRNSNIKIEKE